MQQKFPIDVFISYSRSDSLVIDKIEKDLNGFQLLTWVDRSDLMGGDDWADEIESAIDNCKILLVAISAKSVVSKYVKMEYRFARTQGKIVIPVLLERCKLPIDLNSIQAINIYTDYPKGLKSLISAIRFNLNTPKLSQVLLQTPITNEPDEEIGNTDNEVHFSAFNSLNGFQKELESLHTTRHLFDEAGLFSRIPSSRDEMTDIQLTHPYINYVYHVNIKQNILDFDIEQFRVYKKGIAQSDKVILFSLDDVKNRSPMIYKYDFIEEEENLILFNADRLQRYISYISFTKQTPFLDFVPPEIISLAERTKRIFPTDTKILAIAQIKGGTGKTTSTFFSALSLAKMGYKVLIIDMDDQCNSTYAFLGAIQGSCLSLRDYFTGKKSLDEVVSHTVNDLLNIIPASQDLGLLQKERGVGFEFNFSSDLHEFLQKMNYDWVIIDTKPSTDVLTRQALLASHFVIAPFSYDFHSLSGFNALQTAVSISQTLIPSSCKLLGGFVNQWQTSKFRAEGLKELKHDLSSKGMRLFTSLIPYDPNYRQMHYNEILTGPGINILSLAFDNLIIELLNSL